MFQKQFNGSVPSIFVSLSGDGELVDNQGTSTGSRAVQLYNGRAIIRVKTRNGRSNVAASIPEMTSTIPSIFINL
ncbi:hypothetical protein [Desertivirga xinjiangensis]|uniref:hypothetical protein n=1 Tax=Desertivirga xinjiangensis TaxID=539206 RepID=UPI00210AA2CB|nr:hypothetical protein [Pedobacter xinjiangensis]